MTASDPERSILSSRVDAAAGAARVARYAEAIHGQPAARILTADGVVTDEVRAVMAVADEERVELRAEIEGLKRDRAGQTRSAQNGWRTADAMREAAKIAEARLDALVADLRGLADEIGPFGDIDATPAVEGMFDLTHVQAHSVASQAQGVIRDHLRAVLNKHAGEQAQGGEGS
jgi:hypothetical protein